MKTGDINGARALYERYLAFDPPDKWALTARRAIQYCDTCLSA
jgi:hypothetical protein